MTLDNPAQAYSPAAQDDPQGEGLMTNALSPVFAWQRQPTLSDHAGHLSALFFISGCNFQCRFCHNASLMGQPQQGISWERLQEIIRSLPQQWVDSVTITGGEPLLNPELEKLVKLCKSHGLLVKLDSNGSYPDRLAALLPLLDYVALDIKTSPSLYPDLTGWQHPERVFQSAQLLRSSAVKHELRTTIIEEHHRDVVMKELFLEIRGCNRYVLQPFVPRPHLPDPHYRIMTRTSPAQLQQLAKLAADYVREAIVR